MDDKAAIQSDGDFLTEVLHKVLSYHPETRITIERYHSGKVIAYRSEVKNAGEVVSRTDISLTDELNSIEWDFGYQVRYSEDGSRGYAWHDFRIGREGKRLQLT